MFRRSDVLVRGYKPWEPWGGAPVWSFSLRKLGGVPRLRPIYKDFTYTRPQRPLRAIANQKSTALMLRNRTDQLELIQNALLVRRAENQVEASLGQLALSIRNADDYIDKHLLAKETRPSLHTLFFHDRGLVNNPHIFSNLAAHHLVPILSLLSYDVEKGRVSVYEATQLYEYGSDVLVAHSPSVRRELCNAYIRSLVLHKESEKAIEVIYQMERSKIRRTFVTYAPLFRLARQTDDLEMQMQVEAVCLQVEGGKVQKMLFIDIPRIVHVLWVFVRYNWYWISGTLIFVTGMLTSLLLAAVGLA